MNDNEHQMSLSMRVNWDAHKEESQMNQPGDVISSTRSTTHNIYSA